jgi:hypothetical protein
MAGSISGSAQKAKCRKFLTSCNPAILQSGNPDVVV